MKAQSPRTSIPKGVSPFRREYSLERQHTKRPVTFSVISISQYVNPPFWREEAVEFCGRRNPWGEMSQSARVRRGMQRSPSNPGIDTQESRRGRKRYVLK